MVSKKKNVKKKRSRAKKLGPIMRELENDHFRVSIFGSARVKRGDTIYKDIYCLAKELGNLGADVVTGGGPGLMEAANRGHQAGRKNKTSHSIGLAIRLPKEQMTNNSLDVVKEFELFSNRLDNFMLLSNAVVIAPGGVGTALEFFYTWQLVQTNKICDIPIIFLGSMWEGLLKWVEKYPLRKKYLERHDLDHIFVAKDYKEVVRILNRVMIDREIRGTMCSNNTKYRLTRKYKV